MRVRTFNVTSGFPSVLVLLLVFCLLYLLVPVRVLGLLRIYVLTHSQLSLSNSISADRDQLCV